MKIENHFVSEIMETKGIITEQELNFTAYLFFKISSFIFTFDSMKIVV